MESGRAVEMQIDGVTVQVAAGSTILEACDAADTYVPRLCHYPGLACCTGMECGLCVVRLADGSTALACGARVAPGLEVTTHDSEILALRRERLARILSRHPHVCLSCPDRDGCARDECSYGVPPEARCCDESGRCELGRLVQWVDPNVVIPRRAVAVARDTVTEGRIR